MDYVPGENGAELMLLKPMHIERFQEYLRPNTTFAAQAAVIHIFLKKISPDNKWTSKLYNLLTIYKFINPKRMGFVDGWQNDGFWGVDE
jgi:hypothetical protein